jgi:hypothetical protein
LGAHPPDPLPGGLCPLDPLCPPSQAQGSPAYWVPLVAWFPEWATCPLFWFWGDTPQTPAGGLRPLDPLCPPSQAQGSPAYWAPLVSGLLMWATRPSFKVLGGTSPTPPGMGLRPLHPRIKVGEGRPFSKRLTSVGVNGTPPRPPARGLVPPGPPFAHPRKLRVRRRIGSHSWRGC